MVARSFPGACVPGTSGSSNGRPKKIVLAQWRLRLHFIGMISRALCLQLAVVSAFLAPAAVRAQETQSPPAPAPRVDPRFTARPAAPKVDSATLATISGVVTDRDGRPMGGVLVSASSSL